MLLWRVTYLKNLEVPVDRGLHGRFSKTSSCSCDSMYPILENDDSNRALMGANMQRQAVPLLNPKAPFIGTGMEYVSAHDSGVALLCKRDGVVESADAKEVRVRTADGSLDTLPNHCSTDQTRVCYNQRPIVAIRMQSS